MPSAVINGATLHYEEHGRGEPVLFLHGTGAHSPAAWERCIEAMPAGRRLITYDRRGFGRSRGSLASGLKNHVEDAAALLEHLEASPAAIVTQSGGAVIALKLVIDRPDLIDALIMGEPAYQVALHPSLSVTRALAKTLAKWGLSRDAEGAAVHYYRWATRYQTGGNSYDDYPLSWQKAAAGHARATLREVLQLVPPTPRAKAVRSISCPITLVIGDLGEPVFRRTTRRVHRLLPNARLAHVADTSHLISTDQPRAFAAVAAEALGLDRAGAETSGRAEG